MESIKEIVREILRTNEQTRDNDTLLCLNVYVKLKIARKVPLGIMIEYQNLEDAPSFETITRVRREIQNEDQEYRPSRHIQEKREKREKEYKEHYNHKKTSYATASNSQLSW